MGEQLQKKDRLAALLPAGFFCGDTDYFWKKPLILKGGDWQARSPEKGVAEMYMLFSFFENKLHNYLAGGTF